MKIKLKQLRKLVGINNTTTSIPKRFLGSTVVVRCRNAGVHSAVVESCDSSFLHLKKSHRVWLWKDAFTLSQLANDGISVGSKTGQENELTIPVQDVAEIILQSEKSRKTILKYVTSN